MRETNLMTVQFIAEVSSNHNQDLDRCLEFVEYAAEIGCNGIKFQLFRLEELFAPEILNRSTEHKKRKNRELPLEFLPFISDRCKHHGILFGCTPFYLDGVRQLEPFVDFYKIASYELLWLPLIADCAKTGKPLMLSTGMATLEELTEAVDTAFRHGCSNLTVFHCVSGYPTPVEECNLSAIETIAAHLRVQYPQLHTKSGWSDHTAQPSVIYRAVHRWQAQVIEFHLDIEGQGEEFAAGHCWLPEQIAGVITKVKDGIGADGNSKKTVQKSENSDRLWRADPFDGLRPLKEIREKFRPEN